MKQHWSFALVLVILVSGCGTPLWKRETVPQTAAGQPGHYEIAWVNPTIVVSDSLFTLISAERLDSVVVDNRESTGNAAPAVTFFVAAAQCPVSANLITHSGQTVLPLVEQNLPYGHYKLTLDSRILKPYLSAYPQLYLAADYCGSTVWQPIK
ncbi:MAG TPA: hypothetical protein VN285_04645 [Candidatus Deferrimicrobium sp.]|nr:hypothetical protein [Candidatus Deferrimicrobium sp.]